MAHKLPAARWLAAFMLVLSAGEESDVSEREREEEKSLIRTLLGGLALNAEQEECFK